MAKAIEGRNEMVYVQDIDGKPLMPTERYGKVRRLLDCGRAKVVCRCPFTIRLAYGTTKHVQMVTLGVDAGSKHIGLSATTEKKELYAAQCDERTDVTELLASRRELRIARRNRTTRYRKARFDNRMKGEGWLAPSVRCKVEEHLRIIEKVNRILPISKTVVEVAQFVTSVGKAKCSLGIGEMFFRGILCNALVCLAVWCGSRLKEEISRLVMVFWCIFVFMVCGFEHSIANMAIIGIPLMSGTEVPFGWMDFAVNLAVVTGGNIVGGLGLIGVPYFLVCKK